MPEQETSRFEAFKQGISERLDSFKQGINRLKTVGEIAGLGVGISLGLVATAGAEEPVHNTNIPVLETNSFASTSTILNEGNSTAATASDATQDCVDAALAKPKVWNPHLGYGYMAYPGDRRKQAISSYVKIKAPSPACQQLVIQEPPQVVFKVQNPNDHKKWGSTKPQTLIDQKSGDNSPMKPNQGGVGHAEFGSSGGTITKNLRYRCTPGKGITKVEAVYQLQVDSALDGSNLGNRSYTLPVKIKPVPSSLVQGGGVPKAC